MTSKQIFDIAVRRQFLAAFLTVIFLYVLPAQAQNTYRCGNTYSQAPCADGVAIDAQDKRTDAQKNQADATTARVNAAQKELETERLAREKREAAANRKAAAKSTVPAVKITPIKPKPPKKAVQKKKKPTPKATEARP